MGPCSAIVCVSMILLRVGPWLGLFVSLAVAMIFGFVAWVIFRDCLYP